MKPSIEHEEEIVKTFYFSAPMHADRITTLLHKLESSKVSGRVNKEDWGYLIITDIYQERFNHQQYLIFWKADIIDTLAFNRFKLSNPQQYTSLRRLLDDGKYPKTVHEISDVEYTNAGTLIHDFIFGSLGKNGDEA